MSMAAVWSPPRKWARPVLVRFLGKKALSRIAVIQARPDFAWSNPPVNNFIDTHVFAKLKAVQVAALGAVERYGVLASRQLRHGRAAADAGRGARLSGGPAPGQRSRKIAELLERPEFADSRRSTGSISCARMKLQGHVSQGGLGPEPLAAQVHRGQHAVRSIRRAFLTGAAASWPTRRRRSLSRLPPAQRKGRGLCRRFFWPRASNVPSATIILSISWNAARLQLPVGVLLPGRPQGRTGLLRRGPGLPGTGEKQAGSSALPGRQRGELAAPGSLAPDKGEGLRIGASPWRTGCSAPPGNGPRAPWSTACGENCWGAASSSRWTISASAIRPSTSRFWTPGRRLHRAR